MFKILKQLLSRTAVLYVLAAIFLLSVGNFPRAWNHVVTSALSRYMPSHDYLLEFNRDRSTFNFKKNKEFELYYGKLSALMPDMPDAYAMQGFCYYYDGKTDRALAAYQQAVRLNPKVFNFYYNQGIIALKTRDEAKALALFKKSLSVPLVDNLQFIVTSRVYKPLLPVTKSSAVLADAMGQYLIDAYGRAYLQALALAATQKDYATMLLYARQGVAQGVLDQGVGSYYAGLASFGLKKHEASVGYIQEAVRKGFSYAQAFEIMGHALQALKRPESAAALMAATSLARDGKIYRPSVNFDLLVY